MAIFVILNFLNMKNSIFVAIPLYKENIYPKNKENLIALLNFYFSASHGNIDELMENELSLNQLEFIANKVSKYTFYLEQECGLTGKTSVNYMKYGIDIFTRPEISWQGSKNRKRITSELKKLMEN